MQVTADFVISAAGPRDFPRDQLPEVALVGRSNVGKSTLINALVRRTVARTSAEPGKTRLANYYRVRRGNAAAMYLVDLPGYGYARAPRPGSGQAPRPGSGQAPRPGSGQAPRPGSGQAPRPGSGQLSGQRGRDAATEEFNRLTEAFFARSDKPIATVLLVDSRHPGLESDREAWDWLGTQPHPRGIVGTKVDKLTRTERVRHTRQLESLFDVPVLLVSAQNGEGLEELWKLIARLPSPTAA